MLLHLLGLIFRKRPFINFYETFLGIIFPESGGMVHNVVAFIIEKQAAGEILVCGSPLAVEELNHIFVQCISNKVVFPLDIL